MDNYNQTNELLFTRILCEFHICLGCGYTQWRGHCSTCGPVKLTLLEIVYWNKV